MNAKWVLKNIEEIISASVLFFTVSIIIFNVLSRYIFSYSFGWIEELAMMGFAWCTFIGASAAYKRKMHYGIDFLVNSLPVKGKTALLRLTYTLLFVVNLYITYLSIVFAANAWIKPTPYLNIPYTFIDISATIGFGMMSTHSFRFLLGSFTKYTDPTQKASNLIV